MDKRKMVKRDNLELSFKAPKAKTGDPSSPSYMIARFDPSPAQRMLKKLNYFFKPYSPCFHRAKHMDF